MSHFRLFSFKPSLVNDYQEMSRCNNHQMLPYLAFFSSDFKFRIISTIHIFEKNFKNGKF